MPLRETRWALAESPYLEAQKPKFGSFLNRYVGGLQIGLMELSCMENVRSVDLC